MTAVAEATIPDNVRGGRPVLTLALLSAAYFLSLVDRNVLTVLIDPIQKDIGLSDTQFALLQGMAFAVFYITFSIPLATVADRWNRKLVIVGGLAFWSASTCFAGLARSFGWLFAARIGVGAGEACLAPAAYSMFTDLFGPKQIGRVIGIFHSIGGFGIAGASLLGGLLHEYFASPGVHELFSRIPLPPWGMTLFAVGLPGLLLASLILMVICEPMRAMRSRADEVNDAAQLSLVATLLARRGALLRLLAGNSFLSIAGTALLTWTPAYFIRVFDMNPAQAGVRMGLAVGVGALVGPLVGGMFSDALYKRYAARGPLCLLVALSVALVAGYSALPLVADANLAVGLVALIGALYMAVLSVIAATLQLQTPSALRARVSAVWLCLNTLIGLGLGALLVALVTEHVLGSADAVGVSIAIVAGTSCVAGGVLIATLLIRAPAEPALAL